MHEQPGGSRRDKPVLEHTVRHDTLRAGTISGAQRRAPRLDVLYVGAGV